MSFLLSNLAVMTISVGVFWWLSGFDSRLTGKSLADFIRRAVRCGITLLIVEVGFYALWRCWIVGDRSAGLEYLALLVPMALLWAGCMSEAGAEYFHRLIDPQDKRPYDPKTGLRELDSIAGLIRSGRKEEAVHVCQTLLRTSPELRTSLELTLHHLGATPPELRRESKPLADASQLRQAGKFNDAETVLISLLKREPSNVDAALMLIRLYGQDMRQPHKAASVLQSLENESHVPAAYIEFARRSIMDWQRQPAPAASLIPEEPMPESIEELIAKKYLGTAIDVLEKKCEAEPGNFDACLKLAEVHGLHCSNIPLAEKIIRRIEVNPLFNTEQKQQARNHLGEWRKERHRTA